MPGTGSLLPNRAASEYDASKYYFRAETDVRIGRSKALNEDGWACPKTQIR